MPFKQKDGGRDGKEKSPKKLWYIHVPMPKGGFKALCTGTKDRHTARQMERMIEDLRRGPNRDPELLAWLADRKLPKEKRLNPLTLFDKYSRNKLNELRSERAAHLDPSLASRAADVNAQVDRWHASVKNRTSTDNAERYLRAVRSFVPAGQRVLPSRFTHEALLDWSNHLQAPVERSGLGLAPNTARRYRVGLLNFIDHLVSAGVLASNPLAAIDPPKSVAPRDRHLDTPDAIRLVQAFDDEANEELNALIEKLGLQVEQLQGFVALINGAGVEVSVALALCVRNVMRGKKSVLAPGTKNYNRKRVVRVAEWAWPWVEAVVAGRAPHERLFDSIPDRWIASDAFNAVISKLAAREPKIFGDYWLRDGRHTYAVRAIKGGTPPKVVATQLGHKDPTMVHKVYGVYEPGGSERDYWEERTAERDREEYGPWATPPAVAKPNRATPPAPSSNGRPANAGHAPKIAWPTVEELLVKLARRSVSAVAKELGVSDQALRKHLRARGVTRIPDGRRSSVVRSRARGNATAARDE